MSAPALHEPTPGGVVLYSLPAYEPGAPGRRWSSLRPANGPQLALVTPPDEPSTPTAGALWRLVLHLLEVLDGRRTVNQLRTILSDGAYEALLTRLRVTPPGRQHRLLRLHTCHPATDVVEASAVIDFTSGASVPRRVQAAAIRLERSNDRWHWTVLRIL